MELGNPVEPQGQGSLLELKVGEARAEPSDRRAEMERSDQMLEEEQQDPLAQALLVVEQPEARCYSKASPETAKGCKHLAEAGL